MSVRGSQGGMAEAFLHPTVGRNVRLETIDGQIDWSRVETVLAGLRPGRMGPPSYPGLLMFKALLLQQWYGLSDPGLEEALCDRMSFRRFVGLAGDQAAPDHATLWRFRQGLAKTGLDQAAFEAVAGELDARGLIVRQGTLIDASLVASQSRPPSPPDDLEPGASRLVGSAREPDADWTRRGSQRVFGYKVHVAVDKGSGLVRRVLMTPASVNDTVPADDLMLGDEKAVWADKAYDSHARRARLKARASRTASAAGATSTTRRHPGPGGATTPSPASAGASRPSSPCSNATTGKAEPATSPSSETTPT